MKVVVGQDDYQEYCAMTAEESQSKLTMTESELEVVPMERKHKNHKERKVSLRQGEDRGPRPARTDAEEGRSKLTVEGTVMEAGQMERKRKRAEDEKCCYNKGKFLSHLEQTKRLLEREEHAGESEQDLAFSLSQSKQTVEEALLVAEAFIAYWMESCREMHARALLELEQRSQQREQHSYVDSEQGARDMAAEVTVTLKK